MLNISFGLEMDLDTSINLEMDLILMFLNLDIAKYWFSFLKRSVIINHFLNYYWKGLSIYNCFYIGI